MTRREFFLESVSNTFHGRDLFAPVAAHLASGIQPNQLGATTTSLQALSGSAPVLDEKNVRGCVMYIDTFGNAVTNINQDLLKDFLGTAGPDSVIFTVGSHTVHGIHTSYASTQPGTGLGIVGSFGLLEIAVCNGNAAKALAIRRGDEVTVSLD